MRRAAAFLLAAAFAACTARADIPVPHPVDTAKPCTECHTHAPAQPPQHQTINVLPKDASLGADGVAMCESCHKDAQSHVVGVVLDFSVPADLPLDANGAISCLTCHYTHGSLESDTPRASFSFMDRMLGDPGLKKSYLLRRSNVNGELCLACHATSR